MSGTTRTVQQPLDTRSFASVIAMAAIVLAATMAIAWGTTNLGKAVQGAAPAPLTAPAVRDLGARDLGNTTSTGLAPNPVRDLGSRDTGGAAIKPYLGAPGAYRTPANSTSGSSHGHGGLRAQ